MGKDVLGIALGYPLTINRFVVMALLEPGSNEVLRGASPKARVCITGCADSYDVITHH
jgi:hypothetical protein